MSGFKLLAIRPLAKCDKGFLKILKVNVPYVFFNEYDFSKYTTKERILSKKQTSSLDIYSFYQNQKKINVNVSALVGQNGSGKSSLVELFYVACFNISAITEVLIDENIGKRLTSKDIVKNINVEIFYQSSESLFLLELKGKSIKLFILEQECFKEVTYKFNLNHFFYTIAINYSVHSLNSKIIGDWIDKVFHKNDGYQTPIVLNPYREEGIIDINKEEYLIKSRLVSNILGKIDKKTKIDDSLRNIIDNKIAYRLHVSINKTKFKFDKSENPNFDYTEKYGDKILPKVYEHFLGDINFIPENTILNNYAKEYILYKLFSIVNKYDPYKRLFRFFYEDGGDKDGFLIMLSQDLSHVTFKLRQAINFLKNKLYFKRKEKFDLTIEYLSRELISKVNSEKKELIELLPPAFFDIDIEFKNGDFFNQLSSGEKQRIYSLSTLLYHISNVNSASSYVLNRYNTINIIFDELELYFHPDLQRNLVNDILEGIKKINFTLVNSINILFITHSPFILSDISKCNTLVLNKDGSPSSEGLDLQTFGANIFDLLKHSFFLDKGPMGEFAKNKINNTIDWINNSKRNIEDKEYHKFIIKMIGEPILQNKLAEMYDVVLEEKFENEIIQAQIHKLQRKLKK